VAGLAEVCQFHRATLRLVEWHWPGRHLKVCVTGPGGPTWRSFTLSSAPTRPDLLELTIKRNPTGVVSAAIQPALGFAVKVQAKSTWRRQSDPAIMTFRPSARDNDTVAP
jgi:ferredoxin-NADP reductase